MSLVQSATALGGAASDGGSTRPAGQAPPRAWLGALVGWAKRHPDAMLLGGLLLAAGLLRAAFWLRATVFIIADSENYFLPGFQLARGLGFELEARRAPLYPLLIAGVVAGLGQDLAALALAQHLLGLLTVGCTYLLGRSTFGRAAGLLAGLLVALNGSLLIAEQTVSTETPFIALLSLAALAGVAALREGRPWLALAAGLLLGLAALTRSVAIGLLPLLPLLLALEGWLGGRRGWAWLGWVGARVGLFGLGVALVLLPWMVRNYLTLRVFSTEGAFGQTLVGRTVRHDRFVFVQPGDPPSAQLAPGSAEQRRARARELMHDAASRGSFITPLRRRLMQELGLTELQANTLMRDLAVEAVRRQLGYYLFGTARFFVQLGMGWPERVRDHWQSRREAESREEWESHPTIAGLLGPPSPIQERQLPAAETLAGLYQPGRFGPPLLALFGLGLAAAASGGAARRAALLPGLWAVLLVLVGVALVGPVLRYRYPAEPFLALLAAGGLVAALESARGWRRRRG